ncbi:hypothetical protein [Actinomycetospora callitridis]|uniref:hypothetical protein n=1 Tax=Actinomycetospora callitridis TaxID=913944 RepID=UPI002366A361|nr:hypothetical protein [Actinomycetospora callitridis]MDD7921268.1 hypothetical protein [Actinomycetospora callitridis]
MSTTSTERTEPRAVRPADPLEGRTSARPSRRSRLDRPAFRLVGFALALVLALAAGATAAAFAGPTPVPAAVPPPVPAPAQGPAVASAPTAATGASGLAVSQGGYTLDVLAAPAQAGSPGELAFRVLGPGGAPVTAFTPTHDKRLHLILVRRDQSGFQHLHPVMDPGGTWRTTTALAAGDHRVFADFAPDGRSEAMTLGRDIAVAGDYRPAPLPPPSTTATTADGYTVTLTGALVPGTASPVTLSVSRNGAPVTDLQPYLAAYGHLVALRTGDLAYLHVHPTGSPGDGRTPAGPAIEFLAEVPSAGPYRLYLDFAHQSVVRTAEFTVVAATNPGTPVSAPSGHSESSAPHGH